MMDDWSSKESSEQPISFCQLRARCSVNSGEDDMSDMPIHRATMSAAAHALDEVFNGKTEDRKVGFVLLAFEVGKEEKVTVYYISNCTDRKDAIAAMKAQIKRFENQQ
jgi:hypothetical protein